MEGRAAATVHEHGICVSFEDWTQQRTISSIGTNAGADKLPFQQWHHFKEAFAPEVVDRAIKESSRKVASCLDPFGGSGTTALACQFLGVEPTTVEVNPYLADLIQAKLQPYDSDSLARSLSKIVQRVDSERASLRRFKGLPPTFIESDTTERWIFDRKVALRISAYLTAIDALSDSSHRRLFRVLIGGMLVQVSNVIVNGKGRRYRKNWGERLVLPSFVDSLFVKRATRAIAEIHEFRHRRIREFNLWRGDSRSALAQVGPIDLAVFSPPYPNSFDYTDVYNVELWMLGYLASSDENRALRTSTLCSHVQIKRDFSAAPKGSRKLKKAMTGLGEIRDDLWSPWIPEMVGAYFHDMNMILGGIASRLNPRGETWAVVGDSRYGGVNIPTAGILADLAPAHGYKVVAIEPFRSMRVSAQQGGRPELDETLLVLRKA